MRAVGVVRLLFVKSMRRRTRLYRSSHSSGHEQGFRARMSDLPACADDVLLEDAGCVVPTSDDSIWMGDGALLIRMEAVDEGNTRQLFSTLENLGKSYSFTRILGSSFLRVEV